MNMIFVQEIYQKKLFSGSIWLSKNRFKPTLNKKKIQWGFIKT